MKNITSNYKNEIYKFGRQIDSKITYELDGETIELGKSQLNSVTPHYESDILKSVMKQLDIDSNVEIPLGTILNYQFGVFTGTEYEYINYGNYVVYKVEKEEDTYSYKITCYDKMLYAMKDYINLDITYPITIRNYINTICTYLGLTFANSSDTFANYDKEIQNELYLDNSGNSLGYTFRDVFDELAQVTASTICINNNDELEIRYINDTEDTIDEKYLKDINVKFGKKYGPVNSIVLSRASESDNVFLQDDESIEENGLCEIKIKENQIMNFNDRSDYLEDILEQLDGLEYYINDFSSTGITYYELCDMYNVSIDNNTYKCIMLNDETIITQGLEENVHTDMPQTSETDYKKADRTDRKINQTYIIADKQQGQIEALTSRTTTLEDETKNMYTIEQVNQLIQTAESGVTNTFSEAGGNNIFRNTGLWFEDDDQTQYLYPINNLYPSDSTYTRGKQSYEFWSGRVLKNHNDKSSNETSMLLQNSLLSQEQNVPNGNYTISFKYKKLIELANCKVYINDIEFELIETTDTEFIQTIEVNSQHINVKFSCNIDSACEIYDLMVNAGSVKLAYSQNQNETTTETVNISKGITITSSNTETTFRANSDGIRTLDKNGNVLTYFTDKGMTTKSQIVEDDATICDVLIQKVGNHTWFTKI